MFCYTISALSVACDLELLGPVTWAARPDTAEVTIRAGDVLGTLEAPSDAGPNWQMTATQFLIEVPGIVRMSISDGSDIRYQLIGDTDPYDAAAFITGTGFGILLHQRGCVVLHASAVRVGNTAVLFCGPSGAGKSTLGAALVTAGYPLVTDDVCAIAIDEAGHPHVAPDGRQLKLWRNAIDQLSLDDRRTAPVRAKLEKFHVAPRAASDHPLRLGAVYVLREARVPNVPGITRPNIVEGAVMLRGNAYRPAIVRCMGHQKLYFHAAATIAQHAGVFTLTRPLDFAHLPTGIAWLEEHWRDLGLVEKAA